MCLSSLEIESHACSNLYTQLSCRNYGDTFSPGSGVESPPRAAGKIEISHLFESGSKKKSPAGVCTESPGGLLWLPQLPKGGVSLCLCDGEPVGRWISLCGDPVPFCLSWSGLLRCWTDAGMKVALRWMWDLQNVPYPDIRLKDLKSLVYFDTICKDYI